MKPSASFSAATGADRSLGTACLLFSRRAILQDVNSAQGVRWVGAMHRSGETHQRWQMEPVLKLKIPRNLYFSLFIGLISAGAVAKHH